MPTNMKNTLDTLHTTLTALALGTCLATGCGSEPNTSGDTLSETTGTTTDDSGDTSGTSGTVGPSGTETTTETTTDSGETSSETHHDTNNNPEDWPLCISPDEDQAAAEYGFDFSQWDPNYDGMSMGQSLAFDASCWVKTIEEDGAAVSLTLSCTAGDLVDVDLELALDLPEGTQQPLQQDQSILLSFTGHGETAFLSPGSQFAIHNDDGTALLLGGFQEDTAIPEWWENSIAPLTVYLDQGICPPYCPDDICTTRQAVVVGHNLGGQASVIDQTRDTLATEAGNFEVIVSSAKWRDCLDCNGTYQVLIVAE